MATVQFVVGKTSVIQAGTFIFMNGGADNQLQEFSVYSCCQSSKKIWRRAGDALFIWGYINRELINCILVGFFPPFSLKTDARKLGNKYPFLNETTPSYTLIYKLELMNQM